MASAWELLRLPGPEARLDPESGDPARPSLEACRSCGGRELYRQPDFRRSIGLWIIAVASVATVLLMVEGYNWFVIWSPMMAAVIVDRIFLRMAPDAVICYCCGLIHRGLSRKEADRFEAFDLETHDRHRYAEAERGSL